ncbi:hypothetical protein F4778DRAFT_739675, partial [Xylariomycetidae sp. FL2044]
MASLRSSTRLLTRSVGANRGFRTSAPSLAAQSGQKAPSQKYPLYPSVEHLVKEHKLDESAISQITPTGPAGRLLKGDVLAYLGSISSKRPAEIMARFQHNSHLDLSNIKLAAPKEAPSTAVKTPVVEEKPPRHLALSLPVSLAHVNQLLKKISDTLGIPVSQTDLISRASKIANKNLPLPSNYKPSADELFNQVLGIRTVEPKGSQGYYTPAIKTTAIETVIQGVPFSMKMKAPKLDVIDYLAGHTKKATPRSFNVTDVLTLSVPPTEEKRGKAFLEKMKALLEKDPGHLLL